LIRRLLPFRSGPESAKVPKRSRIGAPRKAVFRGSLREPRPGHLRLFVGLRELGTFLHLYFDPPTHLEIRDDRVHWGCQCPAGVAWCALHSVMLGWARIGHELPGTPRCRTERRRPRPATVSA
jgi:hypothetical protein